MTHWKCIKLGKTGNRKANSQSIFHMALFLSQLHGTQLYIICEKDKRDFQKSRFTADMHGLYLLSENLVNFLLDSNYCLK